MNKEEVVSVIEKYKSDLLSSPGQNVETLDSMYKWIEIVKYTVQERLDEKQAKELVDEIMKWEEVI